MDNLSDPSPNSIFNFHAIHFSICLFIDNFIFEYLHGTQKSSKSQHEDVSKLLRNIVLGFHSISQYVVLTFMPLCQKKCQKEHKFPFFHNRHPTYFCHLYETLIQSHMAFGPNMAHWRLLSLKWPLMFLNLRPLSYSRPLLWAPGY